jgi:hypothetical protein
MVWVDAGDRDMRPLDGVTVDIGREQMRGEVAVAPDQLLRPVEVQGRIIAVRQRSESERACADLPGAEMPPLGTALDGGVVVAVDAVNRTVTVEAPDGTRVTRPTPPL